MATADMEGSAVPWCGEDRRKDHVTRSIRDIHERLDAGDKRMKSLEEAVGANTDLTTQIKSDTAEIVDFAQSLKGTIKVFNLLGKLAKPLTYIVMLVTALVGAVSAIKSGSKFP